MSATKRAWVAGLVVLLTAGCGRAGYDELSENSATDATLFEDGSLDPALHDEDGDGLPDLVDNCPHVPNTQQENEDGDGVGDACDPNQGKATDSIAFFDPFIEERSQWEVSGPARVENGRFIVETLDGSALVAGFDKPTSAELLLEVSGSIEAVAPGDAQAHMMVGSGLQPLFAETGISTAHYYCELCQSGACGPQPFFAVSHTLDNTNYIHQQEAEVSAMEPGPFRLQMRQTVSDLACEVSLLTQSKQLAGTVPTEIAATRSGLRFLGLRGALDYVIVIKSD